MSDRIDHMFEFMEYDYITEDQRDYVISFEEQWKEGGSLSSKQVHVLESIFRAGNVQNKGGLT